MFLKGVKAPKISQYFAICFVWLLHSSISVMHFLLLLSFTVWVGMCATSSSDDLAQYEDSFTRNVAGDSVDADVSRVRRLVKSIVLILRFPA